MKNIQSLAFLLGEEIICDTLELMNSEKSMFLKITSFEYENSGLILYAVYYFML
jgi:hypothetical protein